MLDCGLLISLIHMADPKTPGVVHTNAAEIAKRSKVGRSLVQKYLRRLEATGHIKRFARERSRAFYKIEIRKESWNGIVRTLNRVGL
jgi:DNA-binding MarR family transcriptional regulator